MDHAAITAALERSLMTDEEMVVYTKIFNGARPPWIARRRLEEAEGRLRRCLSIEAARHGPEHPRTVSTRYKLGSVLQDKGELGKAEEIFCAVLPIFEKVHGTKHPDTVELLNKLALVLRDRGKLDEAEAMFYRVLAIEDNAADVGGGGGGPQGGATQAGRVREFFHPSSPSHMLVPEL